MATTPTTYTLKVKLPSATTWGSAESGVTVPATGTTRKAYVPAEAGVYAFQWTGTGAAPGLAEGEFVVFASLAT